MPTKSKARPDNVGKTPKNPIRAKLIAFAHMYRGGTPEQIGNATRCYMALHPRSNANTARVRGHEYLKHPIVQEILQESADRLVEQADVTQAQVLDELRKLAFFDVRKLYNDDGSPKGLTELDDDTAAAIIGLDSVNIGNSEAGIGQVLKYKLADKKGALELFGKHLKLWTDKVEATVNGGKSLAELAKEARDESE